MCYTSNLVGPKAHNIIYINRFFGFLVVWKASHKYTTKDWWALGKDVEGAWRSDWEERHSKFYGYIIEGISRWQGWGQNDQKQYQGFFNCKFFFFLGALGLQLTDGSLS